MAEARLQRCLTHREAWRRDNPHAPAAKGTKAGRNPASTFPPQMIRSTLLFDLVNTMDPKLAVAAFGMDPQAGQVRLRRARVHHRLRTFRHQLHLDAPRARSKVVRLRSTQRRGQPTSALAATVDHLRAAQEPLRVGMIRAADTSWTFMIFLTPDATAVLDCTGVAGTASPAEPDTAPK
ncbi:hypothetical protein ACIF83_35540 [Streptomyces sp. NPDC085866]|uniref:hypothetical protein n=1 Tax=Streptomyces sp. NPDC085866 TaxID=3365736 RepID=UPI0037D7A713